MEIADKFQIPVARGPLGERFQGSGSLAGGGQGAPSAANRFNPAQAGLESLPRLAVRSGPTPVQSRNAPRASQGLMSQAAVGKVDDSRRKAIMSTVDGLVHALQAESMDFVTNVYDKALESPRSITDLSRDMSDGEVLTEMVFMIDALERVANKLETGSVEPYLSPDNKATLASLHELYSGRRGRVPDTAKDPIARGNESLSSDYVDQRVKPLENLSNDVDRMIVSAEGGLVNVHEPGESRSALEVVGGLALLAVAAYGLYAFFSAD